jgi:TIR domain
MNIFISYSHKDAHWLERLKVHLRPFERAGRIDAWSDTRIATGNEWRKEIKSAIASAQAAVLLVSADFLASEFITSNELPPLLLAAKRRSCAILPIIVGPCLYPEIQDLRDFQAANSPRSPLGGMRKSDAEKVLSEVAMRVLELSRNALVQQRPGRLSNVTKKRSGKFVGSPEIDDLIKNLHLGEWDAAERVALNVIALTNVRGKNRVFDALLRYADCPDEDDRFWGATMTFECCLRYAPWLITRLQFSTLAKHKNFSVRSVAASICLDMAQSAPDRVPIDILIPLSRYDEDWYVEAPANAALKSMASAFPAVLEVFFSRLQSNLPEERLHAASAIRGLTKKDAELLDRERISAELARMKELGDQDLITELEKVLHLLKGVQRKSRWRYGL